MRPFAVVILCMLLFTAFNLYAQLPMGQFGIFGALSLPQGDFGGDDPETDNGMAKTGYGGGLSFTFPLGAPNLSWQTDGMIILNSIDESVFEDQGLDIKGGRWMNIPIMTGLKYSSGISPVMEFFILAQVGLTFINGPDMDVSEAGMADYEKWEIGSGTSFGFGIGAGVTLSSKLNFSLRYLALGSAELEVSIDGETIEDANYKPSISMILLTAGINLR